METIVEILVEAYRENVAAAVAEHGDNITEEQRAVITDRFIHNFKTNLEVGLAAVFGNVEEKKPVTEVGVEDLLRKGESSFIFYPSIHLPTCFASFHCEAQARVRRGQARDGP